MPRKVFYSDGDEDEPEPPPPRQKTTKKRNQVIEFDENEEDPEAPPPPQKTTKKPRTRGASERTPSAKQQAMRKFFQLCLMCID